MRFTVGTKALAIIVAAAASAAVAAQCTSLRCSIVASLDDAAIVDILGDFGITIPDDGLKVGMGCTKEDSGGW